MIFLRFPDQETGLNELRKNGFITIAEDGSEQVISATHDWAIDVIGPIYRGGAWDPETGEVITPPTLLDGWHVNYQGVVPEEWEQYLVTPQNPARSWAGVAATPLTPAVPPAAPTLVRARDAEGHFIADDPATSDVDEAWVAP